MRSSTSTYRKELSDHPRGAWHTAPETSKNVQTGQESLAMHLLEQKNLLMKHTLQLCLRTRIYAFPDGTRPAIVLEAGIQLRLTATAFGASTCRRSATRSMPV